MSDHTSKDIWYRWLLGGRDGESPERRKDTLQQLAPIRDKVLERGRLAGNGTLLDVGSGDGLIGLGALEGSLYDVIFSDISSDLLEYCREIVEEAGLLDRCRFELLSADNLHTLPDTSVDVVTTRSVLIYVTEKQNAFNEFFRVLKPGGRISLFEPINRFGREQREYQWMGYDMSPVLDLYRKVRSGMARDKKKVENEGTDPMIDFDERDLIRFAEEAGFSHVFLDYHVVILPPSSGEWHTLYTSSPNPKAYSLKEAAERSLTEEERKELTDYLKPLVDRGEGRQRRAYAYLYGMK